MSEARGARQLATCKQSARVALAVYVVVIPTFAAAFVIMSGADTSSLVLGAAFFVVTAVVFWQQQRTHVVRGVLAIEPNVLVIQRFASPTQMAALGPGWRLTDGQGVRSGTDSTACATGRSVVWPTKQRELGHPNRLRLA